MTREEATGIIDAWVNKWRLYLDGGLHKLAREALIEALSQNDKPQSKRGRPAAGGKGE